MTPLKLAILNLSRRKLTTVFAIISISVSVACSGLLLRSYLLSSSRFNTLGDGGDAIVGAKNSGIEILLGCLNAEGSFPDFIPYVLFESLRKEQAEPGTYASTRIKSVIPFLYFAKYKNYRVAGTDESFVKRPPPSPDINLAQGNWAVNEGEIVIGYSVAQKENLKIDDEISVNPWLSKKDSTADKYPPVKMKVTGIFDRTNTAWDFELFSNVKQAQNVYRTNIDSARISIWGPNILHYYLVYLDYGGKTPFVDLINKRTIAQVVFVTDETKKLRELLSTGKNLGIFITSMIILLGGLVVSVLMITRFDAMKIQLAVLRAIGYRKKEIAQWLLWEGILLGISACIFGALLDIAMFPLLKGAVGIGLPETAFAATSIFQSLPIWLITIVATCIAAFIPFIIFNRLDIHRSLKGL
ncbi:MAG: FtsX-like permease family protein [Ignavibacteria bacterium]|nr:FtsX-like permease family protein [Ignavibacteria bacterium]